MKNKSKFYAITKLFTVAVISLFFAVMFIVGMLFPRVAQSKIDAELTEMPVFSFESLLNGEFENQLTMWYTDTIYMRDDYKDLAAKIKLLYGPIPDEEIIGDTSNDLSDDPYYEDDISIPPTIGNN